MPHPIRLGYLTSVYGRASDIYIRCEVACLRELGHEVGTFSIRRPDPKESVSEAIRREQAETKVVLEVGFVRMAASALRWMFRSPKKWLGALKIVSRLRRPGLKGQLYPLAYFLEAAYLAERLKARGFEHLHNHIAENSASVAMIAAELAGIPFSLTIHGPSEFDRPMDLALDVKIRRASFVAAVTEFGRSQLFRWSDPADWPKIRIVRSGLEPRFLGRELDFPPDRPRLISIGRLAEQKGLLVLVEAAGRLVSEGIDLEIFIIGDGPMRKPIEDAVNRLGLGGRIKIAGWMSSEAVLDEILKSRALVLPSFAEGLPMVIMEALALGRPVISTYIAGIPELVEPGKCGWLVPASSVDALARAIREALASPVEDLARMGREGAGRVAERHDPRIQAGKMSALFGSGAAPGVAVSSPEPARLGNTQGITGPELIR